MHIHRLWAPTSLTLLVAVWGSMSAAASAATPGLAVNPNGGPPLTTIKITGQGFCKAGPSCGPVSITIAYVQVDSSDLTWTSGTSFTGFVRVPGSARPGADAVVAEQTVNGNQVMARTTFNVATGIPAPTSYPTPASLQPPGGFPATTVGPSSATTTHSATTPPPSSRTSRASTGARETNTSTTGTTTTRSGNAVANNPPASHTGTSNSTLWIILALAASAAAAASAWAAVRSRRRRHIRS